ncbi:AAA family ATPase [Maritalea mobilis]|uniref:AAA family ATPase n=1 Tax=Maritalea mobilis TaxID=483324 RepID=UPI001C989899|nr:AAA family ATPase [Maritalea mobilis]MBY6201055.1 AAA family ATPase [Maritalea mobilis]
MFQSTVPHDLPHQHDVPDPATLSPSQPDAATWIACAEDMLDRLARSAQCYLSFVEADAGLDNAAEDDGASGDPSAEEDGEDTATARPTPAPSEASSAPRDEHDETSDWDHPEEEMRPEDLDLLSDPEPHLDPAPVPLAEALDPRAGLRPKPLHALLILRLARTFGSVAALQKRLCAPGAITALTLAEDEMSELLRDMLPTFLMPAKTALLREAVLQEEKPRSRVFQDLTSSLRSALEMQTPIILVGSPGHATARPLAELAPTVLPLAPLDRPLLSHLLFLLRPDLGPVPPENLPGDSDLARLAPTALLLALRTQDRADLLARIAEAVAPARETPTAAGRSLSAFPLPPDVRSAVEQLLCDLRDWRAGALPWSDVSRGLLLTGPPGNGKTELARLIAREAGIEVRAASLAQFQSSGARGNEVMREMHHFFAEAAAAAPCIAFLDELDAFGDRARPRDHNSAWTDTIVAGLLECLDGFETQEGVVTLAATNQPAKIDAALRRPGRFDRVLYLGPPSPELMAQAIGWHLFPDLPAADLTSPAKQALGMTGAEVAALVRAARARARQANRALTLEDLQAALDDIRPPLEPCTRHRVAIHECGHALAAHATGHGTPKLIALHAQGGTTEALETRGVRGRPEIEAALVTLMAGRAAEKLAFGNASTGAGGSEESDLALATTLAASLELSWGLGDTRLWRASPEEAVDHLRLDPVLRARVDGHLSKAEIAAVKLLKERREALERMAEALVEKTVLKEGELEKWVGRSARTGSQADEGCAGA